MFSSVFPVSNDDCSRLTAHCNQLRRIAEIAGILTTLDAQTGKYPLGLFSICSVRGRTQIDDHPLLPITEKIIASIATMVLAGLVADHRDEKQFPYAHANECRCLIAGLAVRHSFRHFWRNLFCLPATVRLSRLPLPLLGFLAVGLIPGSFALVCPKLVAQNRSYRVPARCLDTLYV